MFASRRRGPRPGFTLTELIVAMTIMLIIAGIAVALLPKIGQHERSARGADLLQRWLLIARQRALSDRTPTGLRLVVNPAEPNVIRELHYIAQPEDYSKGQFLTGGPGQSTFQNADFWAGKPTAGGPDEDPVQGGDYLETYGGGLVTQITGVDGITNKLTHLSATPLGGAGPTSNYRVIRQPRRLRGESPLVMPQNIAVDLGPSRNVPARAVGGQTYYEVLFAPSGNVIGKGTTGDKIILYVRDVTLDNVQDGAPTLIVIYVRSGMIAAHPVDRGNPDPYSFARNPRSSGL